MKKTNEISFMMSHNSLSIFAVLFTESGDYFALSLHAM